MLTPELKNALLTTQLCQYLEPHEIEMLTTYSEVVLFTPGQVILQQGKASDGLYVIIEGDAVVTAKILGEGTTILATLSKGNILGEISSLEKEPHATSVIASSGMQCLFIKGIYLEMLSLFFPETKFKIMKAIAEELCDRLKNYYDKIVAVMAQSEMITRPFFGKVIKSFTKPELINTEEFKTDIDYLRNSTLFESFSKEEYEELWKYISLIKAPKQCPLIREKHKNAPCYILLRGAVQSSIVQDNKVAKLSVLGPMTVFGSISIAKKSFLSIINYTSCEQAILLKITDKNINLLQKNSIHIWHKLFDLICKSFFELVRSADKLNIRLNGELYNR